MTNSLVLECDYVGCPVGEKSELEGENTKSGHGSSER